MPQYLSDEGDDGAAGDCQTCDTKILVPDDWPYGPPSCRPREQRCHFDCLIPQEVTLNKELVDALESDIAAHGLLSRIVVDLDHRIIDGHQRYTALERMRANAPESFALVCPDDQVPVVKIPMSMQRDPKDTMRAAIASKVLRHAITKEEVVKLDEFFQKLGYARRRGRPKKGTLSSINMLAKVLNRKPSWVRWVLTQIRCADSLDHPPGSLPQAQEQKQERQADEGVNGQDEPNALPGHDAPDDGADADTDHESKSTQDGTGEAIDPPPVGTGTGLETDSHQDNRQSMSPPTTRVQDRPAASREPVCTDKNEDQFRSEGFRQAKHHIMHLEPRELWDFHEWYEGWYAHTATTPTPLGKPS